MQCKFLQHGVQIHYSGLVKPCCVFEPTESYRHANHISQINLTNWHNSDDLTKLRQELAHDQWPQECRQCADLEQQGRGDSARLGGQQAYADYGPNDITLEIRPGNTCNFACQTCWPAASSRVSDYYRKAGIPIQSTVEATWNYTLIQPILPRIKDIVILGGEPFYDKKCVQFLRWLVQQAHQPKITMFTNGSLIDFEFLAAYQHTVTLVFSLDAIERPAEYIRYGTEWPTVYANYLSCKKLDKVDVRVNITTSPYNYPYLASLIGILVQDWPTVVSWGVAGQGANSRFMSEAVIPVHHRAQVIKYLESGLGTLQSADIEHNQRINACNAMQAIITNLDHMVYDANSHQQFKTFVQAMDHSKRIRLRDYCPETADYLGTA
jgi:MoaA/NifB/PqqE/SkfB family radical SAM enzyme